MQQSYSLPLEFKQIFEAFLAPLMPGMGRHRERAYRSDTNSGCVTLSGIGSTGTLNSRSAKVELL